MSNEQGIEKVEGFGQMALKVETGEQQAIAIAESKKAEIQASYIMAIKNPRSESMFRQKIIESCKNKYFANSSIWKKPVGGKTIEGFSVRFTEEALRLWGNTISDKSVIYEDDEKKVIRFTLLDLETNTKYCEDATITKTIERKNSKGYVVVGERKNSYGEDVFIVKATDDDIQNKEGAIASKKIRNLVLRIIPPYVKDEAREVILSTMAGQIKDPKELLKKLCDSFSSLRVSVAMIEKYLGHKIEDCTNDELVSLNQIYQTVKDGEASFHDYISEKKPKSAEEIMRDIPELKPASSIKPTQKNDISIEELKSKAESVKVDLTPDKDF
jgi:hypothetical protein